jgi:hypothetical protein
MNNDEGGIMKLQSRVVTSVGLLLATASFSQQVQTDFNHGVDFAKFKTYSWAKIQTSNAIWDDRVKEAVNGVLAARGWTQVASGGDVALVAIGTSQNQQTLETVYNGLGGWRWQRWQGMEEASTTVETYKVGTLVIDMFDANSRSLIWRGSSTDTVSDKPDKNIKNFNKGVQKMFQHFPPAPPPK